MPDLMLLSLNRVEPRSLASLMEQEEKAWWDELGWDYAPIRQVLASHMARNLLPGFVILKGQEPAAYGYFLVTQNRGIVGTVYAPPTPHQALAADSIIEAILAELRSRDQIRRIESQILPFHGLGLTGIFARHGFRIFTRYFMEVAIGTDALRSPGASPCAVTPWNSALLGQAARVLRDGYRNGADAELSEEYRTDHGCEGYLRSMIEHPGCGSFLPEASFMAIDDSGRMCGFILCSRISPAGGMIPQIAIAPAQQGKRLGAALMRQATTSLALMRFRTLSLTVTKKNSRAFEWYCRLGFRIRKEFAGVVWESENGARHHFSPDGAPSA